MDSGAGPGSEPDATRRAEIRSWREKEVVSTPCNINRAIYFYFFFSAPSLIRPNLFYSLPAGEGQRLPSLYDSSSFFLSALTSSFAACSCLSRSLTLRSLLSGPTETNLDC